MRNQEIFAQCGREAAIQIMEHSPWFLIPDLNLRLFRTGMQQVYCRNSIPSELDADFLIVECLPQGSHLQLVCLAGPQDDILRDGIFSAEMQAALTNVTRWSTIACECLTRWLRESDNAGGNPRISYRIVIGDSQRQSDQERAVVRSLRTNKLRIRSYRWLLEKQSLYPELKVVDRTDTPMQCDL
jgi:hypothetical protein